MFQLRSVQSIKFITLQVSLADAVVHRVDFSSICESNILLVVRIFSSEICLPYYSFSVRTWF